MSVNKNKKKTIDPVVMVVIGIALIVVAIAFATVKPFSVPLEIPADADPATKLMFAFVTGLFAGGLSCVAVQGGLLTSSLARQLEQDYSATPTRSKKQKGQKAIRSNTAFPIFLFLLAKVVAYTALGAILGLLGSLVSINPMSRAILLFVIGIFLVGNALRMFNVHPIFRYFAIEPPKFITRYIRRTAKGTDTFTPLFLGALTVFIPCGVTMAMMATALGTGSAMMGAALMFAFTLGTSPIFFGLIWAATTLGQFFEKTFMRFVAVVMLILGFVTIDSGLNLLGSPLSFNNLTRNLLPSTDAPSAESVSAAPAAELTLNVQNGGYFPQTLKAKANEPIVLSLVTDETYSCARDFVIPALNYYQLLETTGTVQVNIPAQAAGTVLRFTCSMGMYTGQIVFE